MNLVDEVVLITGVGPGLGTRLALRAAADGAKVVVAACSGEVLEPAAKEVAYAGGEALAVQCDVRQVDDVERLVATAVDRFGSVTGLVNSAYSHPGLTDLLDTPDHQLRRAMDVILPGVLGARDPVHRHDGAQCTAERIAERQRSVARWMMS